MSPTHSRAGGLAAALSLTLVGALAVPAVAADSAEGAVNELIDAVEAGDFESIDALVCEAEREAVREQLDPGGSMGGIEIGFDAETARLIAAQTVLGAASLLIENGLHPEREIDRVTTPRGCTIAGLNEMEHQGFGSAIIKGILTSERKAKSLY